MPEIIIYLAEGRTVDAKRQVVKDITDTVVRNFGVAAENVAIQIVDMMTGPGDSAGAAGAKDGRIDALLDKGVYKLRTTGAKGATQPAALKAEAFRDIAAPAPLGADPLTPGDLGDMQQRSFWVDVDSGGGVAVEVPVKRRQRHEIHDVQRIRRMELGAGVEAQAQGMAAAAAQGHHEKRAGPLSGGGGGRAAHGAGFSRWAKKSWMKRSRSRSGSRSMPPARWRPPPAG